MEKRSSIGTVKSINFRDGVRFSKIIAISKLIVPTVIMLKPSELPCLPSS